MPASSAKAWPSHTPPLLLPPSSSILPHNHPRDSLRGPRQKPLPTEDRVTSTLAPSAFSSFHRFTMDYYISPSSTDPSFDSWKSSSPSLSFPVSDARSIPWSAKKSNLERHQRSSPQPIPTKRIVELPKEFLIQRGFLRDKGRLLYTVKHSSVLSALTYTRRNWTLPESLDDRIKAILALETFLNPFGLC